jgi:selenocysteine-specific elongation factor
VRAVVIGTAGHIDHGKSALVKALTGTDPDRLKEEKARGITIDLGFAHTAIGDFDVAFVDVPGHERFVKNMLAGVGGIDAVLLVIAADESVMPQTREHFAICRLLQVRAGVIALTKADLVDADTLELARMDARELVAGSAIADAPIVPVSAKTGDGLEALRAALEGIAQAVPVHATDGPPRLPIDRVFSMRGFGTVVTGTLTSGVLQVEDELIVEPSDRRVKVRGIQVHGAAQTSASAGRRVAVNLGGVDVEDLSRGDTLTRNGAYETTRRFDAVIDLLPDAKPLRHGARVRFHNGTTELLARVSLVNRELAPGESSHARLRLEAPAVLTRGDRFILRQYSPPVTIGGGRVLDPVPARTPIRTATAAARFERLTSAEAEAAMAFIDERRGAGLSIDALSRRAGVTRSSAAALAANLEVEGRAVRVGDELFSAPLLRSLEDKLVAAVDAYHRTNPMAEGLPREEARERLFTLASPSLFDIVLQRLAVANRLVGRDRLALPGRGVSLTPEELRAQEALDRAFRAAALAPQDVAAAAAAAGVPAGVADRVAKLMIRQKTLVKVDTLVFHADALERLKREVTALKGQGSAAKVDVAAFKERYGISRKYAIPLLEWLDRERVTRRVGDARIVL